MSSQTFTSRALSVPADAMIKVSIEILADKAIKTRQPALPRKPKVGETPATRRRPSSNISENTPTPDKNSGISVKL